MQSTRRTFLSAVTAASALSAAPRAAKVSTGKSGLNFYVASANPVEPLCKHYSAIMEASKVPVYLYHIPGTSAVPITHELLHKLEHYPNLAGIKDSTGNAEGYAAFVKEFPKLDMMSGTDNNIPTA